MPSPWKVHDNVISMCRAAPGGQIIAGRCEPVTISAPIPLHVLAEFRIPSLVRLNQTLHTSSRDQRSLPCARRMSQETWEDGVGGWVLKLQPDSQAANQLELSVLFEQGRMGLPTAWHGTWCDPPAMRSAAANCRCRLLLWIKNPELHGHRISIACWRRLIVLRRWLPAGEGGDVSE